jgi:hypothetical protein
MTPILRTLLFAVTVSTFVACEKKPETTGEKIENKVGDALDNRPGEKVRDAAEDTKEAVKDAVN